MHEIKYKHEIIDKLNDNDELEYHVISLDGKYHHGRFKDLEKAIRHQRLLHELGYLHLSYDRVFDNKKYRIVDFNICPVGFFYGQEPSIEALKNWTGRPLIRHRYRRWRLDRFKDPIKSPKTL